MVDQQQGHEQRGVQCMFSEDFGVYLRWRGPELDIEGGKIDKVRAHAGAYLLCWLLICYLDAINCFSRSFRGALCYILTFHRSFKAWFEDIKPDRNRYRKT